jgi:TetR/AcrR family transcriptional regulator, transcriptional repressor for nem operon
VKGGLKLSRSRKIEPEAAIQAAQSLFWKHGYCGLGTRQIEEETGLTRFTLQTSYGGKKSLFLQTLDSYLDHFETGFLPRVRSHDLEPLASWFEACANPALMREVGCYGCLMLNSTIEFQGQDADINLRTDRYFKSLRKSFRAALLNARKHGVLSKDVDVSANVEILLGLALGLNVVIRAAANNAAGRQLAASTANMIRKWR